MRRRNDEDGGKKEPLHGPAHSEVKLGDREQAELCQRKHWTQSSPLSPLPTLLSSAQARTHTRIHTWNSPLHTEPASRWNLQLLCPALSTNFHTLLDPIQLLQQIPPDLIEIGWDDIWFLKSCCWKYSVIFHLSLSPYYRTFWKLKGKAPKTDRASRASLNFPGIVLSRIAGWKSALSEHDL